MMKFFLRLLSVALVLMTFACAGKENNKEMDLGIALTNRAVNYALQGQTKMADFTYTRAVAKFRDMGRFCDMARVALSMYTVLDFSKEIYLNDALGFATLGICMEELNIVGFLADRPFEAKQLPEPYSAFAKYKKNGKIAEIISAANSYSTSDKVKSFMFRFIARELMVTAPDESINYARKAMVIDEQFAWTMNLFQDETIILEAMKKLNRPTDLVESRLEVLQKALSEKY